MNHQGFTRREFLYSGLAVVSTAATVPTFLQHSGVALAQAPGTPGNRPGVPEDRILVVLQLSGGNDGLNTVVPFGMDAYYKNRTTIGIDRRTLLTLDQGRGLGLHPGMAEVFDMMQGGKAAIIQGVGYPNPNRSHFASMDIWHTGDTLDGTTLSVPRGTGWVGRAMDDLAEKGAADHQNCLVCVGDEAPLAAEGKVVAPIAFENAGQFRWVGGDLHPALGEQYEQMNRQAVEDDAAPGSQAAFVRRTQLDAQLASDRIRRAVAQGPITSFPAGRLANQLKMVAAMIRAELPTRVYYVGLGGFDTHAGQPARHAQLLTEFANSVGAFYRELEAMGQQQRVLTMAFSEFGRRVRQNASAGTDHGTAGPMFLFGPMVRAGVLNEHPALTKLDDGDLIYNTDFRSVYASILDGWLKADSAKVLGRRFQPARILTAKA
jgi:uncharacterized protein (DUF1501 family)